MKKILVLVIIIALGVAAAPYLAGQLTESRLNNKIGDANGQLGKTAALLDLTFGLEDYQRGYSSSTATLILKNKDGDSKRYPLDIRHAPLTLTGFDIARITIRHPQDKKALPDGDLRVNLLRQLTYQQNYPAQDNHKGGNLTITGPEKHFPLDSHSRLALEDRDLGLITFDLNYSAQGLDLRSSDLHYKDSNTDISLKNPRIVLSFARFDDHDVPIRLEYSLSEARIKASDLDLTLRDNGLAYGLEQDGDHYNLIFRAAGKPALQGNLVEDIKQIIPVIPDDIRFDFAVKNLSADTVHGTIDNFRAGFTASLNAPDNPLSIAKDPQLPGHYLRSAEDLGQQLEKDLYTRDLSLNLSAAIEGAGKGIRFNLVLAEHLQSKNDLATLGDDDSPVQAISQYLHGSSLRIDIDREVLGGGLIGIFLTPDKLKNLHFADSSGGYTFDLAVTPEGLRLHKQPVSNAELETLIQDIGHTLLGADY